mgnify:FL=1
MIDYREDISETPKWQHDCDSCVFIGGMSGVGTHVDFYICPDCGVVARYGSATSNNCTMYTFSDAKWIERLTR